MRSKVALEPSSSLRRGIMGFFAPLHTGARTAIAESERSTVNNGHLPDVVVLDHLLDQKYRDVRTRDSQAQPDSETHVGNDCNVPRFRVVGKRHRTHDYPVAAASLDNVVGNGCIFVHVVEKERYDDSPEEER